MRGCLGDGFYCVSKKEIKSFAAAPYVFGQRFDAFQDAWKFLDENVGRDGWTVGNLRLSDAGVIRVVGSRIENQLLLSEGGALREVSVALPELAPFSELEHQVEMVTAMTERGMSDALKSYQVNLEPIPECVDEDILIRGSNGMAGPGVTMGFLVSFRDLIGGEFANVYLSVRYDLGDNLLTPGPNGGARYHLTVACHNFNGVNPAISASLLEGVIDYLFANSVVNEFNRSVLAAGSPARSNFIAKGLPYEMNCVMERARGKLAKLAGNYFDCCKEKA